MSVLVIAEHNNKTLHHGTLSTLSAAAQISSNVKVLVVGYQCADVAKEISQYDNVEEVIWVDNEVYEYILAENAAQLIKQLANDYTHIFAPATTMGKNLLPRVAGLLELGQISDIIRIIDESTFVRPIYAGNALATVASLDPIKLITVRITAFPEAVLGSKEAPISKQDKMITPEGVKFIEQTLNISERPDLTAAKIVISGGRGLQSSENFKLLEELAKQLGAALGASRAAVDAGYVPNDYQVGQTGKVVAPNLYFAIGISGAIQHVAGMKESKIIVAINKDPDAPIFAIADYGLVADLFTALPELQKELTQLGYTI